MAAYTIIINETAFLDVLAQIVMLKFQRRLSTVLLQHAFQTTSPFTDASKPARWVGSLAAGQVRQVVQATMQNSVPTVHTHVPLQVAVV